MSKVLIIAAHPDDEILGAGGTILKHRSKGDEVAILILGECGPSRGQTSDTEKHWSQARQAGKVLGVENIILEKLPDNKFDSLPLLEIVKKIEPVIADFGPEIIYTHFAEDLNIDHRLTCQAVMTACRPQPGFGVKAIYSFEILSSTEWQIKDGGKIFCPTKYIDISRFIDKKIAAFKCYTEELRAWPHPRSEEGVITLAKYRGLEVGLTCAEAFRAIRVIS